MAKKEIELIKDAGVVGAGGAGFPTHVKLDAQVEHLIVNAAECEPLINVDKQLLEKNFNKVYEGLQVAAKLTGAKKVTIALKEKYKKAIESIKNFKKGGLDFEIFELGNFYPAGDEQVLVNEVAGKIVPEGGIPLMVGCVVINVETLLNVAKAMDGESVTQTYLTISGAVKKPVTLLVPVGTPVKQLLELAGGVTEDDYIVIDGGPMMGKLIDENDYSVKKVTKSILVLPRDNIVAVQKMRDSDGQVKRAQSICLSCRMCTDLCPRYLLGHDLYPDEMMKRLYKKDLNEEDIKNFDYAYLCCDCGLCELYSCVVDLSPRAIFNYLKDELGKMGIKNPHTRDDVVANEFKDYRKVPVDRLKSRLEIDKYDVETPLIDFNEAVDEARLYLSQHVGAPSKPVVNKGDKVSAGDVVADIPEGALGAKVHSPISGKVKEITDEYILVGK